MIIGFFTTTKYKKGAFIFSKIPLCGNEVTEQEIHENYVDTNFLIYGKYNQSQSLKFQLFLIFLDPLAII